MALVLMPRWAGGGRRGQAVGVFVGSWELLVEGGCGRMCSDMVPEAATGDQVKSGRGEVKPARWPVTPSWVHERKESAKSGVCRLPAFSPVARYRKGKGKERSKQGRVG